MYKLLYLSAIFYLFTTSQLRADQINHHQQALSEKKQVKETENAICENLIKIKVNGLVCDFCARALEKTFGKRSDVSGIDVDLDNGKVNVLMNQNATIDNKIITKLVTDSGYKVVAIDKGC